MKCEHQFIRHFENVECTKCGVKITLEQYKILKGESPGNPDEIRKLIDPEEPELKESEQAPKEKKPKK